MKYEDAVKCVEDIKYKPGWKFFVADNSMFIDTYGGNSIIVCMEYSAPDSSDYPEYKRNVKVHTQAIIPLYDDLTEMEFHHIVISKAIATADAHEAREFYRVGSDAKAPFHPHTNDGILLWNAHGRESRKPVFGLSTDGKLILNVNQRG